MSPSGAILSATKPYEVFDVTFKNKGGRPAGSRFEIAPTIRKNFLEALRIKATKEGITVPELMVQWMELDPFALLNSVAKFTPREVKSERTVNHSVDSEGLEATLQFIEQLRSENRPESKPESLQNVALLPVAVRDGENGS